MTKQTADYESAIKELSKITDFMRWGASRFVDAELSYSHGMSSPLDESVYLVLRALNLPVDTPDVIGNQILLVQKKTLSSHY